MLSVVVTVLVVDSSQYLAARLVFIPTPQVQPNTETIQYEYQNCMPVFICLSAGIIYILRMTKCSQWT